MPKSWDDTTTDDSEVAEQIRARRARSKIPDGVRHREKWRQALDMLDEIIGLERIGDGGIGDEQTGGWGLDPRPVVADARGLPYVLAVLSQDRPFGAGL